MSARLPPLPETDKVRAMRLLAWNIRQGGGSRLPRIADALKRHDADIVVLSEYRGGPSALRLCAALQALGYRQVIEHLRGERSLAETIELVKLRTRQFAKRQMTWFRRQMQLEWMELSLDANAEEIVGRIVVVRNRAIG